MDESKKTNKLRGDSFTQKYLSGNVIDIGAGRDLVCNSAERFDIEDGDANFITQYRKAGHYNAVHSSHCLEHMYNPKNALNEWWELVKPDGYLVIVVPDEDLYEQGLWPSKFNSDHKNTFTLKKEKSWSPVSHNIEALIKALPKAEIISIDTHDQYYNYDLQFKHGMPIGKEPRLLRFLRKRIIRYFPLNSALLKKLQEFPFRCFNVPIDQTLGEASAQIQVIARKLK